jgi:hypothetical protein
MATAAVLTAVGAGVSAYSSYQQGKAAQKLNNYNASVADQAAADKARDGRILANNQRQQNQKLLSRQRALRAKSGVVGNTGTPLLVAADQAAQLEMGALETEITANSEASRLRQQAVADRMAGKSARRAGNLGAAATILQGAGSIASMGANYGMYKGV